MAGGFLNISEAAVHLNISEDAVKQLVDQRKLFALRDTSGYKFKHEELDRYLEDQKDISEIDVTDPIAPDESSLSLDGLELDLSDEALLPQKPLRTPLAFVVPHLSIELLRSHGPLRATLAFVMLHGSGGVINAHLSLRALLALVEFDSSIGINRTHLPLRS